MKGGERSGLEMTVPTVRLRPVDRRTVRAGSVISTTACVLASVFALSLGTSVASAASPAVATGVFAGYTVTASSGTQTVSATFVVPTLNCSKVNKKGFQAVVLGAMIGVKSNNAYTIAGVIPNCSPTTNYEAVLQINGNQTIPSWTVNPGDTVEVTVTESTTASSAEITDSSNSNGETITGSGAKVTSDTVGARSGNCSGNSGKQKEGKCSPVPETTVTRFTAASINGASLTTAGASQENLTDAAGKIEIESSKLSAGGTAFKDTWKFSCGFTAGVC
jgi:hypothetical protein